MWTGRVCRILIISTVAAALAGCRREAPPQTAPSTPALGAAALPDGVVLPRYSEVVVETGKNLAYDQPAATIDPRLIEHSQAMAQRIYRTAGNVYCAVGYGLANMTMIEGTDGVIIVDTLEAVENARQVMAAFRSISSKPVKAVVYTHNHYDHVMRRTADPRRSCHPRGRRSENTEGAGAAPTRFPANEHQLAELLSDCGAGAG